MNYFFLINLSGDHRLGISWLNPRQGQRCFHEE